MREPYIAALLGLALALAAGCDGYVLDAGSGTLPEDDDPPTADDDDDGTPPVSDDDDDIDDPISDDDDTSDVPVSDDDDPSDDDDDPPDGLTDPPPLPLYSGGACPEIIGGPTRDDSQVTGFLSGGASRSFRLIVPESYDGTEPWPLVIGWHWLNASSGSFVRDGELETATEDMGFLALLPDDKDGEYQLNWPFIEDWGAEEELVFFDDMLACVGEQYNVDLAQVHGIGVSAGGLWLAYLSGTDRVHHFASVMTLSGGLGEQPYIGWSMPWSPPAHKFPALVLSGGPSDWFLLDFYAATNDYRDALLGAGHFVVECEHDSGHGMPPIDPPVEGATKFWALWEFMLDHPYGLAPGDSPYLTEGLPESVPEWCAIAN